MPILIRESRNSSTLILSVSSRVGILTPAFSARTRPSNGPDVDHLLTFEGSVVAEAELDVGEAVSSSAEEREDGVGGRASLAAERAFWVRGMEFSVRERREAGIACPRLYDGKACTLGS